MKETLLIIGLVILAILLGLFVYLYLNRGVGEITSFEECVAAGYPVMESYPRQCSANGQTFVEIITDGDTPGEDITLETKTWTWAGTQMDNGRVIKPQQENASTVTFNKDGRVQLTTDCNNMGGGYRVEGSKIIFDNVMTTLMGCPEWLQESEFSVFLQEMPTYRFTELGELVFEMDSGTMFFR